MVFYMRISRAESLIPNKRVLLYLEISFATSKILKCSFQHRQLQIAQFVWEAMAILSQWFFSEPLHAIELTLAHVERCTETNIHRRLGTSKTWKYLFWKDFIWVAMCAWPRRVAGVHSCVSRFFPVPLRRWAVATSGHQTALPMNVPHWQRRERKTETSYCFQSWVWMWLGHCLIFTRPPLT